MDDHLMAKVRTLGIMQGRLSPPVGERIQCFPRETWSEEFGIASQADLDAIEWVYDMYGEGANPLESDEGISKIRSLSLEHDVAVESICADWFMEEPLIGGSEQERMAARRRLHCLLDRAKLLGIGRVVLPFVDASAISSAVLLDQAVEAIEDALPHARESGIELHLETSLGPQEFAKFLSLVPDPKVWVNYDIGNSSSLGYDPHEEFAAYGERLGSIHIKDRIFGGGTVALGSGDADFKTVFLELSRLGYEGPFILQAARGEPGDELMHARTCAVFARGLIGALPVVNGACA
jgi:hexulose-6-phosphate isomerase